MSVEVVFSGRLGNNLFQYVLGRIIAEHHGFELNCHSSAQEAVRFMGKELDFGPPSTLENLREFFPNAPLHIPGKHFATPVETFDINVNPNWAGHSIDLQTILASQTERKIRLAGFFQRYEYFNPHSDRIKEWLHMGPVSCPFDPGPRDVVVNIRRGLDYWLLDWTLSMGYYRRALARLGSIGTLYVCGTGIDDQIKATFADYDPIYYDASPIEHFAFMKRFDRIVISNSTFAWWAAFLSEAKEIYAPHPISGQVTNHEDEGVDLTMHGPRYHPINVSTRARLAFSIKQDVVDARQHDRGNILVDFQNGDSRPILLDGKDLAFLRHFLTTRDPLPLGSLRQRCPVEELEKIVSDLISNGVISEAPIFLDDPEDS